MTRPEYKGQGMARYLLKRSINALIAQGYSHLELLVTDGNTPAQTLYTSLGFQEIPAV
jgi:ribosomal protein S18 acetylase RimI-like enzyme